jgi:pPIWI RE three-gene island domain Z
MFVSTSKAVVAVRDVRSWRKKLFEQLRSRKELFPTEVSPIMLLEVELALELLLALDVTANPNGVWHWLTGLFNDSGFSDGARRQLHNARLMLVAYRAPHRWQRDFERYCQLASELRGFEIVAGVVQRKSVRIASDRFSVYQDTLNSPPPHAKRSLEVAKAGTYQFWVKRKLRTVRFTDDVIANALMSPLVQHDATPCQHRNALEVTWTALLDTAAWMDQRLDAGGFHKQTNYLERLRKVHLESVQGGHLRSTDRLRVQDVAHWVGTLGAGKSTLMDVLAAHVAKFEGHVTLVVGDVVSALEKAVLFGRLGLPSAPILGASNRVQHINKLQRALEQAGNASREAPREAWRWLSTACPLEALLNSGEALPIADRPCTRLLQEDENPDQPKSYCRCPFYAVCPSQTSSRDAVQARIWIATPASLTHTHVPIPVLPQRMRFLEFVYRRSDLVIVDEADRVQAQLDGIFSTPQTLVGQDNDAWLDALSRHVLGALEGQGRRHQTVPEVHRWSKALLTARSAADRLYRLLLSGQYGDALMKRLALRQHFTTWSLLERLRDELGFGKMSPAFEAFLDDPLGVVHTHDLAPLANLACTSGENGLQERLRRWLIGELEAQKLAIPEVEILNHRVEELEFTLLTGVLLDAVDVLLREWRRVSQELELDEGRFGVRPPPEDLTLASPAAPMGNVLALQYNTPLEKRNTPSPGDLRFIRCSGVGRWLLLHLNNLFPGDGIVGPNVLLLSGTSWAGESPGFHLQLPVVGVLNASPEERAGILESKFSFDFVSDGTPVRVSGLFGDQRYAALEKILRELSRASQHDGRSRFERDRDELPEHRRRVLLCVGSYEEARVCAAALERHRPDWKGAIQYLVSDDALVFSDAHALQRGQVSSFAHQNAWLLIAPLLSIERGHNIVNADGSAAIGAAYFLVRPHPRPDDLSHAILSINRHAIDVTRANRGTIANQDLDQEGWRVREAAKQRWRKLLHLPMILRTMNKDDRTAVIWNELVVIWQVIGRLVRGGNPARVYFVDAAFAPQTAESATDTDQSSLLLGIRAALEPLFKSPNHPLDAALAKRLYGAFYAALITMEGLES